MAAVWKSWCHFWVISDVRSSSTVSKLTVPFLEPLSSFVMGVEYKYMWNSKSQFYTSVFCFLQEKAIAWREEIRCLSSVLDAMKRLWNPTGVSCEELLQFISNLYFSSKRGTCYASVGNVLRTRENLRHLLQRMVSTNCLFNIFHGFRVDLFAAYICHSVAVAIAIGTLHGQMQQLYTCATNKSVFKNIFK